LGFFKFGDYIFIIIPGILEDLLERRGYYFYTFFGPTSFRIEGDNSQKLRRTDLLFLRAH